MDEIQVPVMSAVDCPGVEALAELLALKPDLARVAREDLGRGLGPGDLVEHVIDGLCKAGPELPRLDAGKRD